MLNLVYDKTNHGKETAGELRHHGRPNQRISGYDRLDGGYGSAWMADGESYLIDILVTESRGSVCSAETDDANAPGATIPRPCHRSRQ